ncbi:hypothetical protein CK203_022709 [Vitis vinifera]|uniref:Uncharacterized protein n=1 Tax=Vitis vinifera TaxID=29760 RepID=A0A438JEB5_VITVI|nr:hypothetical protein CK203_022709 [Vitis vinifera]
MAQDKRKVVGQNDNETESLRFDYELHALRQNLKTSQVKERSKEKQRGKASKVKRSKEDSSCSLLSHFWSTSEVHFIHAIYHFKAQEVKNPTLQTVYDLELK